MKYVLILTSLGLIFGELALKKIIDSKENRAKEGTVGNVYGIIYGRVQCIYKTL